MHHDEPHVAAMTNDPMAESQSLERESSWPDEYLKWICGFANAHGGVLVIGKNDRGELITRAPVTQYLLTD